MKKVFLALVALSCLAFSSVETKPYPDDYQHQILLFDITYHEDERFCLYFDKEIMTYFVIVGEDEIPNPYDLLKKREPLDFAEAQEIFPELTGCEHCYGYQT